MGQSRDLYSRGIAQKSARPVLQPRTPVELFREALRAYDGAAGSKRQAWLIEAVIRTSRGVATNPAPLGAEDKASMTAIRDNYRALADDLDRKLGTYADAAALLRALFF
jgi:hypothetical protein